MCRTSRRVRWTAQPSLERQQQAVTGDPLAETAGRVQMPVRADTEPAHTPAPSQPLSRLGGRVRVVLAGDHQRRNRKRAGSTTKVDADGGTRPRTGQVERPKTCRARGRLPQARRSSPRRRRPDNPDCGPRAPPARPGPHSPLGPPPAASPQGQEPTRTRRGSGKRPTPLVVAAVRPPTTALDVDWNAAQHAQAVRLAQARVVVFPELSLTG